jgi:hypothetical protein
VIGAGPGFARLDGDCVQYRPALLGLLEDPIGVTVAVAARAHLGVCTRCRTEVADAVLLGIGLRRAMAEAAAACPPPDAWPQLRDRVQRGRARPRPGRMASPVTGLALSAGMSIAMLIPLGLPVSDTQPVHEAGIKPAVATAPGDRDGGVATGASGRIVTLAMDSGSEDDYSLARADAIRQSRLRVRSPIRPRSPLSASPE